MSTSNILKKYISMDKSIRISAIIATEVVREICLRQEAMPLATIALGRLVTGTILLAGRTKLNQRIGVLFDGNGSLGPLYAEAFFGGAVRAYCSRPEALPVEGAPPDKIGSAMGQGTLQVTHVLPHQTTPHRAMVEIQTGEVGDDIAYYLHQSLQIPSVVALGVALSADGTVAHAGGLLVELLPDPAEDVIQRVEMAAARLTSVSETLSKGGAIPTLIKPFEDEFGLIEISTAEHFHHECRCSIERIERSITLLGLNEITNLIAGGSDIDITCEFCREKYKVTLARLQEMKEQLPSDGLH